MTLTTILLTALLATPATGTAPSPVQQAAGKALAGKYGTLAPWQRAAYTTALRGGNETLTADLSWYQPKPRKWCSTPKPAGSPPWYDRRMGGANCDARGRDTLRFGVLAANLGARGKYAGHWRYGTAVWFEGQLYVIADSFGTEQPRHRWDVCQPDGAKYLKAEAVGRKRVAAVVLGQCGWQDDPSRMNGGR
jgi:hypothetical protein